MRRRPLFRSREAGFPPRPVAARPLATLLALAALVLALHLLDLWAIATENAAPRFPTDAALVLAGLGGLALAGIRLSRPLRVLLALPLAFAALLGLAEIAAATLFGRDLHPYWDLRPLPDLARAFVAGAEPWAVAAALLALLAGPAALLAGLAWTVGRLHAAARAPVGAAALAAGTGALLAAAFLAGWPAYHDDGPRWLSRLDRALLRHAALIRDVEAARGDAARLFGALPPEPPAADLARLAGGEVAVVFVESYGQVAHAPGHATALPPARFRALEARLAAAGLHVRTAHVAPPTTGGLSWLSHATLLCGLRIDSHALYERLLATERRCLPRDFAAAGHRAVAALPGLTGPWPEGAFYGFDRLYRGPDLGYAGPAFGPFRVPDQATLHAIDRRERTDTAEARFLHLVLVSSHLPFAPVPRLMDDWDALDDPRALAGAAAEGAERFDPRRVTALYRAALAYDLDLLVAWLARSARPDGLTVIVGDHQPPAWIAGEAAPWLVPMHVVARDPRLLDPFAALGFAPGLSPPDTNARLAMEAFRAWFLAAYSSPPSGRRISQTTSTANE